MLFAIPYDKFHPSRVVCLHSFQNPENHSYRVQMQDGPLQNHLCVSNLKKILTKVSETELISHSKDSICFRFMILEFKFYALF
jgi:hypothetical protein